MSGNTVRTFFPLPNSFATRLEAAKASLGAIVAPTQSQVNLNVELKAGYVIDLSERPVKRSIDAAGRLVETPIDDGKVIEHKIIGGHGLAPGWKGNPAE